jgi:5'-nucleotidase/UDP-sugar diphosphatase
MDNNNYTELVILHTNDSHGSIFPVNGQGGLSLRATYIKKIRNFYPHVLLVDAGDINMGQLVSNVTQAEPDFRAYNYMKYDAIVPGNHEFDGPAELFFKQKDWASFEYLTSNIYYKGNIPGKKYIIKEYNGIKTGIFGILTCNTIHTSATAAEFEFKDEIETAREIIKELKEEQKVDFIIALTHLGFVDEGDNYTTSIELAQYTDGIDIIIDGHSHSLPAEPVIEKDTWIVSAGEGGKYIGKMHIIFHGRNKYMQKWDKVALQTDMLEEDEQLNLLLQPYADIVSDDLQTEIGEAAKDFPVLNETGERLPRQGESVLGNLFLDSMMWMGQKYLGKKADFAICNGGGLRSGIAEGKITKSDIHKVLPAPNLIEIISMKGRDVISLFDFIATIQPGKGSFAQVSSEVEIIIESGTKKVRSLFINKEIINQARTYRIVTCDYIVNGNEGYGKVMKKKYNVYSSSYTLAETFILYIQSRKNKIYPKIDGRMTLK